MATISTTIIIIVAAIAMARLGVAGWKKLSLRFGQIYLGCFPGQMRSGGRQDPIAVSVHPPSDLEVHPPSDLLPRPKDLALVL